MGATAIWDTGQGSHAEPAQRKVLVAGHGPEDDDECS